MRLTYANVMATLAFFLALGGVGYAATKLPKSSVHTKQIAKGAVKTGELGKAAVTAAKIKPGAVGSTQFAAGAVGSAQLGAGSVGSGKIGTGGVDTADIGNGQVGPAKIAPLEKPHVVDAAGEPGFQNGSGRTWFNLNSGNPPAAFYKDQLGYVHLEGTPLCLDTGMTNKCGGANIPMFQLPSGYRPAIQRIFTIAAGNTSGSVTITIAPASASTPGQVVVSTAAGENSLAPSLDGITFPGT